MALPARQSFWQRTASLARSYFRQLVVRLTPTKKPPAPPGVSSGSVASNRDAEDQLARMAQNPAVFAAITKRALTLQTYPIRVSLGYGSGAPKQILEPEQVAWVAALLTLLERPDPADELGVFPAHPGELLLAQLLADVLATGNAFVRLQMGSNGKDIVGLYRMHPKRTKLVRIRGEDYWEVTTFGGGTERYLRRDVAHLRLLSWESSGEGELGTGAMESLRRLLDAESAALDQTATTIGQGGVDILAMGKTPAMLEYLKNKVNRERLAQEITASISTESGRRVMVVGGDIDIKDAGLKPADVAAPQLMDVAQKHELMALFTVPTSVGSDASTYATAVQQMRVQYENDTMLALVLEICLLRPLAQYLARRQGGQWLADSRRVSAWIDLASHPGAQQIRSEAIARAQILVSMGADGTDAMAAEGLEPLRFPRPPATSALPATAPSGEPGAPRAPLGDRSLADDASERALLDWLRAPVRSEVSPSERQAAWQRAEDARASGDQRLEEAAQQVLAADRARYREAVVARLSAATQRADGGSTVDYGALQAEDVVPDAAADLYLDGLGPAWLTTWDEGQRSALDGVVGAGSVPEATSTPASLDPLAQAAPTMASTSRQSVLDVVAEGLAQGRTVQEIADRIDQATGFGPDRALRIARTETVRAQTEGAQARYVEAEAAGLELEQEWMAGTPSPSQRPEHRTLDGVRAPIGGRWRFADGVATRGPGLSGDPAHDVNCRCAVRAVLATPAPDQPGT